MGCCCEKEDLIKNPSNILTFRLEKGASKFQSDGTTNDIVVKRYAQSVIDDAEKQFIQGRSWRIFLLSISLFILGTANLSCLALYIIYFIPWTLGRGAGFVLGLLFVIFASILLQIAGVILLFYFLCERRVKKKSKMILDSYFYNNHNTIMQVISRRGWTCKWNFEQKSKEHVYIVMKDGENHSKTWLEYWTEGVIVFSLDGNDNQQKVSELDFSEDSPEAKKQNVGKQADEEIPIKDVHYPNIQADGRPLNGTDAISRYQPDELPRPNSQDELPEMKEIRVKSSDMK